MSWTIDKESVLFNEMLLLKYVGVCLWFIVEEDMVRIYVDRVN